MCAPHVCLVPMKVRRGDALELELQTVIIQVPGIKAGSPTAVSATKPSLQSQ